HLDRTSCLPPVSRGSITGRFSSGNNLPGGIFRRRFGNSLGAAIDTPPGRSTIGLLLLGIGPMDDAIRKADVLIEALGYIPPFRDRLPVINLGASAMEDAAALRATLQDVVFMETVGIRPVLVHGGGRPIDRAMTAAGIRPRKVQGRRVTDEATLQIVVR